MWPVQTTISTMQHKFIVGVRLPYFSTMTCENGSATSTDGDIGRVLDPPMQLFDQPDMDACESESAGVTGRPCRAPQR